LEAKLKELLRPWLPAATRAQLRRHWEAMRARFVGDDLTALARVFGSDKWGPHFYTPHYHRHLAPWRERNVNVLEIGIGGIEKPNEGGESLRMWKYYFRRGQIHGIDILDKHGVDEPRITTYCGSQDDETFLRRVARQIGRLDIVIDDGSHVNEHVIHTFETLFPFVSTNGLYVIEDTQTSYWATFGGAPPESLGGRTTMNYFKRLVDGLNYEELPTARAISPFDADIVAIHFYHNLIFVEKGRNCEGSNMIRR